MLKYIKRVIPYSDIVALNMHYINQINCVINECECVNNVKNE